VNEEIWFKRAERERTSYLLILDEGIEELRYHALVHRVIREGTDIVIFDTEGRILIQRVLLSDDTVGERELSPEEEEDLRQAMAEVDVFMREFSCVSEIRAGDRCNIIIKTNEELAEEKFVMPAFGS
jgi:hypothetical protein